MIRKGDRLLAGLVVVRMLEATAASAMLPFILLWATKQIGLGGVAAGALFISQAAGEFLGGLVGGGAADRFGRRRTLLVSLTGTMLCSGVLAIATGPFVAIAAFITSGVFESVFHPTVAALAGDMSREEDLARSFGLLRMGSNVGRIVGPLIGAAVALASLSAVFALSGLLLAAGLAIAFSVLPRDTVRAEPDPEFPPGTLRAMRTDKGLLVLVLGGGLIGLTFAWWEADGLVLLGEQASVSPAAYAGLFAIAAVTVVVAQLPVTGVVKRLRLGDGQVLLAGGVVQGIGLALLIGASAGYGLLVASVMLMALGEMIYAPTVAAAVYRRARPDQRASYQAALAVGEDIATAVGPISGIALARATGLAGLWLVGAGLSALGGAGGRFVAGRMSPRVADPVDK